VLKAPQVGVSFRLYIAAEDKVIGVVLTQETKGKEHVVAYLSQRLVDAETRYTFIEKLCLCLFYACTKCRCYLLSSHCTCWGSSPLPKVLKTKNLRRSNNAECRSSVTSAQTKQRREMTRWTLLVLVACKQMFKGMDVISLGLHLVPINR
jgi:hypothetical protein